LQLFIETNNWRSLKIPNEPLGQCSVEDTWLLGFQKYGTLKTEAVWMFCHLSSGLLILVKDGNLEEAIGRFAQRLENLLVRKGCDPIKADQIVVELMEEIGCSPMTLNHFRFFAEHLIRYYAYKRLFTRWIEPDFIREEDRQAEKDLRKVFRGKRCTRAIDYWLGLNTEPKR